MNDFCFPYCRTCCNNFPMREEAYHELERNGNTFYCPSGHALEITQKSVASRLQSAERSVARQEKTVARLVKSTECLRGVQTRHRNRLLLGHCPYCGDSPKDLVKHIKRHHNPTRA
jgi:hypothetical protein